VTWVWLLWWGRFGRLKMAQGDTVSIESEEVDALSPLSIR
jgi:hypothetical protein